VKFKLTCGTHRQKNADGEMVVYRPGDIVETSENLAATFPIVDVAKQTPRFVLVDDDDSVPARPVLKNKNKKGKK